MSPVYDGGSALPPPAAIAAVLLGLSLVGWPLFRTLLWHEGCGLKGFLRARLMVPKKAAR